MFGMRPLRCILSPGLPPGDLLSARGITSGRRSSAPSTPIRFSTPALRWSVLPLRMTAVRPVQSLGTAARSPLWVKKGSFLLHPRHPGPHQTSLHAATPIAVPGRLPLTPAAAAQSPTPGRRSLRRQLHAAAARADSTAPGTNARACPSRYQWPHNQSYPQRRLRRGRRRPHHNRPHPSHHPPTNARAGSAASSPPLSPVPPPPTPPRRPSTSQALSRREDPYEGLRGHPTTREGTGLPSIWNGEAGRHLSVGL